MYVKCGAVSKVWQVRNELPILQDVVAWTIVIATYVQVGHAKEALDWFEKMQHEGILPNAMTCVGLLRRSICWLATIIVVERSNRKGLLCNRCGSLASMAAYSLCANFLRCRVGVDVARSTYTHTQCSASVVLRAQLTHFRPDSINLHLLLLLMYKRNSAP